MGLALIITLPQQQTAFSCQCLVDSLCRDAGVKAIESLMEKKGKFDYILLETTGLADPGPIASMFWLDQGLGSEIYLDGKSEVLHKNDNLKCSI